MIKKIYQQKIEQIVDLIIEDVKKYNNRISFCLQKDNFLDSIKKFMKKLV